MSNNYLVDYLTPRYVLRSQTEFRLSSGDGLKGLPFSPTWS
jgi:hypothetical protein